MWQALATAAGARDRMRIQCVHAGPRRGEQGPRAVGTTRRKPEPGSTCVYWLVTTEHSVGKQRIRVASLTRSLSLSAHTTEPNCDGGTGGFIGLHGLHRLHRHNGASYLSRIVVHGAVDDLISLGFSRERSEKLLA